MNYSVIAKTSSKTDDFKKWRNVTDLIKFTQFLDRVYPQWKFFNVYNKKDKQHLDCFKQNYRPQEKTLTY